MDWLEELKNKDNRDRLLKERVRELQQRIMNVVDDINRQLLSQNQFYCRGDEIHFRLSSLRLSWNDDGELYVIIRKAFEGAISENRVVKEIKIDNPENISKEEINKWLGMLVKG